MVESISELEKICLPSREVRGRTGEHWITANYQRKISIRLTWLLLHTPITANQTSMLGFLLGAAGAILVSTANYYYGLLAVALLYTAEILDSSDGEIARYRNSSDPKGELLEGLFNSSMVHSLFFIGMAWSAFSLSSNPLVFVTAGLGILFAVKFDHAKEMTKEYMEKSFHSSPKDTLSKVFAGPYPVLGFIGESKHFRNFLILVAVVFGLLYQFILVYPPLVAISYLLFSAKKLSVASQKPMA